MWMCRRSIGCEASAMIEPRILLVVFIPFAASLSLALIASPRWSPRVNILASLASLAAAVSLIWASPLSSDIVIIDDFNIYLILLNSFVGLTTSLFSASYIGHELSSGKLTPSRLRFYHAMYQAMIGSMAVALVANDLGLMWVGLEVATLVTVMMVGIYRTPAAIEAAWKYFILGSVGIALAFFGTILLYLSAQTALGDGLPALAWSRLQQAAPELDPALLSLGFVFFLVGYGTKIGLVPFHAWLPDAHAEGPTPISAVLSGLLLNVALYALLRCKMIVSGNPSTIATGPIMMAMGLTSLLFAALMLYRRKDVKRLFAFSSIEHMGLITFAFGMGGPLANFAGLLQMTMHSLTKSGIFFAVGQITQVKDSQRLSDITGLGLGVLAIAGLPPFGVFMSEFLLVTSTFARQPLLALLLVGGLLLAFAALLLRLQQMLLGEPGGKNHPVSASGWPIFVHLTLVLAAGLYLPPALIRWFRHVAILLG